MLFVKRLGSESCLRRWRGLLELCQRLPKLSELRAGGVSIPLKRHCSSITCLLLGSFCPAHACVFWTHTRRLFASVQSRFETRPPWWFIYDTTDLLSERTSTWCPRMSGRKNWQAWHTASISRQLMCRPDSSSYQRLKVGFPSPQPLLEAYVVTTFLLCAVSRVTPHFSQKGSLQRARADTQARVTFIRGVHDANPQMEPSAREPEVRDANSESWG